MGTLRDAFRQRRGVDGHRLHLDAEVLHAAVQHGPENRVHVSERLLDRRPRHAGPACGASSVRGISLLGAQERRRWPFPNVP
ncbi:MAG: hypothetical protein HRU01_20020 [Myxococcales bacterium]|nr:hypothetical protein [Myxococcales bacterium]